MHTIARRRRGRLSRSARVALSLALPPLLAIAARALGRARRRARRRALLSMPPEESASRPLEGLAEPAPDQRAVDELRRRPRAIGEAEAARILGLAPGTLATLNIPVTRAPDGAGVYDSWEIVHWVDVLRADPAGLELRAAGG